MNERMKNIYNDYEKAVKNLKIAVDTAKDDLAIDGTIKRFELCYELSWKLLKIILEYKGIICKNPRDCYKNAFINKLVNNEMEWMKMIEDRNLLVHSYSFEDSRKIFDNIKNNYINLFLYLLESCRKEINKNG